MKRKKERWLGIANEVTVGSINSRRGFGIRPGRALGLARTTILGNLSKLAAGHKLCGAAKIVATEVKRRPITRAIRVKENLENAIVWISGRVVRIRWNIKEVEEELVRTSLKGSSEVLSTAEEFNPQLTAF